MLTLTYEYKLKPNNREKAIFEDWLEINRKVYNYALSERKAWIKYRSCKINACSLHSEYIIPANAIKPTYSTQCKSLTKAKKAIPELPYWLFKHNQKAIIFACIIYFLIVA